MPDAPGLVLSPTATVGNGVRFGANVVVGDGVVIGDGVEIQDNVVLGKSPALRRGSAAAGGHTGELVIGAGARICTAAIVFAGARIGENAIVGDQAYVRERVEIGAETLIGRGATVENDVRIGARVKIQTTAYITAHSLIEDDVFVGPCVTTTNDDTMSRHDASYRLAGATLRRACRVGGGVVIVPGVEIGEEAFVAAGAVVTNDVPARAMVMGVPGRVIRDVPDEQLLERWR
ncbi:MAG TPA: DapH/DapD/GlmU-related protein [Solirubrobacteraceae bacterium]|nr:DapH/DapD/GlmU-related protein [Solirubrobacteraceae bacterium]